MYQTPEFKTCNCELLEENLREARQDLMYVTTSWTISSPLQTQTTKTKLNRAVTNPEAVVQR